MKGSECMLKGKTIFELTNVNTGEKETYEENTILSLLSI